MPLKPNLDPDDLAKFMQSALKPAWEQIKGTPFHSDGGKDQLVLFTAIASGLLTYLECMQDKIINTISLKDPVSGSSFTYNVDAMDLNTDVVCKDES